MRLKRLRAFTLVELFIAMTITGLVMGSVIALMFSVFKSNEFHQDIAEAKQRGQIALAAIQPYVLNAGLGLPHTSLASAFKEDDGMQVASVTSFARPVQLALDKSNVTTEKKAAALWLVYSMPSGGGVNAEYNAAANNDVVLAVAQFAQLGAASNLSTNKQLLKAWIAFPSATAPFGISVIDTAQKQLTVRSLSAQKIASFDEVHFVRAAKIYVNNGTLTIDRLDGTGPQPVVDGIAGMWCTYDQDGDRLLNIYILARSNTTQSGKQQSEIEGWPSDASPAKSALDSSYRYAVVSRSWRIRN